MKHGHVLMTGVSTLLHLTGYDWSCILSVSLPFKSPASCGVLPAQSLTLIPQNWESADMRPYSATGRQGFKLLAQYPRRAGGPYFLHYLNSIRNIRRILSSLSIPFSVNIWFTRSVRLVLVPDLHTVSQRPPI